MAFRSDSTTQTSTRAVPTDFCRLFLEQAGSLYRLSLMLTADKKMAEQCVTKALEDCMRAGTVFKGWEHRYARRAIVMNAIHMVEPFGEAIPVRNAEDSDHIIVDPRLAPVMALSPIDRFVFIMSVLESYSDHECRVLLRCLKSEIVEARSHALQSLAETADRIPTTDPEPSQSRIQGPTGIPNLLDSQLTGIVEYFQPVEV